MIGNLKVEKPNSENVTPKTPPEPVFTGSMATENSYTIEKLRSDKTDE